MKHVRESHVANRIGEKHIAYNGCEFTIIKANNSKDILVEFEDGAQSQTCSQSVTKGFVSHPTLKTCGSGIFAGFKTWSAFHEDGDAYYVCECQKCGLRDVLIPKQMLQHRCENSAED